jgi:murein DD-endopeptidase MepM/ murein hydrolase activator NlpD
VTRSLFLLGLPLWVLGMVLTFLPVKTAVAPQHILSPVAGRWTADNSPANRTPSHYTTAFGQTFAIDLVYEPEPGARPAFGQGPAFRPPADFPAFGEPVRSPVAGRVVGVRQGARDHRSRSSRGAYAYMMIEGMVRELAGSRFVVGNCVVVEAREDNGGRGLGGVYAVVAHLQRGSATVRPGDEVRAGDVVGLCGNSGNASEPHVHVQLMDHRWPIVAAGVPFVCAGVSIDGGPPTDGVPANESVMVAGQPAARI